MPKRCTICHHPRRAEIEDAIAHGVSLRRIAERCGVSKTALIRHKTHARLEADRRTCNNQTTYSPGGAYLLEELKRAKLDDISDLKRYLEALNSVTIEILRESFQAGRSGTALQAARELRQSIELIAELLHVLNQHPQTTQQVALVHTPEWVRIREIIAKALEPYPEARLALSAALEAAHA